MTTKAESEARPSTIRVAKFHLQGLSPFSPSKYFNFKMHMKSGEKENDTENRLWRERIHRDKDGTCLIPAMMIKFAIDGAAKRMGLKKKGQTTWAQSFVGGVIIPNDARIEGTDWQKVHGDTFMCSTEGKRGPGKRVTKTYAMISPWAIKVIALIVDPEIPEVLFEDTLRFAGMHGGLGRFAARVGGTNGRFAVVECNVKEATPRELEAML